MILLTRPYVNSLELAKVLGADNCVIAPMLEISPVNFQLPKKYQATISTSKNVSRETNISIPQHGKNAAEILQYCLDNLSPTGGKIIYFGGDKITLDIAAELRQYGFDAERVIAYKQIPSKKLEANLDKILLATFFSLNSLKNFYNLVGDYNLAKITSICMSEKIAKQAEKMGWKKIITSPAPNLRSMIATIQEASLP